MIALALTLALASAPTDPATVTARPKLLVLDVKASDLRKNQTESLTSIVTARAAKFGQVDVTSAQDVRELVQMEAEKQSAGCATDSCLAEIAGAMGAQYVFVTRVSKIGSSYVVSVQMYDAIKGTAAARETANADSMDEVIPALSTLVDATMTRALGAPRDPPAPASAPNANARPPASAPSASTPSTAPHTAAPDEPERASVKNPDWLLLLVDYILYFIPIPGAFLLLPLVQGLVANLAGAQLANNEYPYWWAGTLAGYGMLLVSGALLVGGYVALFGGLYGGASNTGLLLGGLFGGLVLFAIGAVVGLAEPAVVYFISGIDAHALPPKADARASE